MKYLLASLTLAAALTATSAMAVTLIPISSDPGGQTPEASAEQWLQWVLDFETSDGGDPISDTTGEFQNLNQDYPVYMLGGTFGGAAERSFTAQAGKTFLIPLQNRLCIGNIDSPCGPPNPDQDDARAALDNADRLFLKIDGEVFVDAETKEEVDTIDDDYRIETSLFNLIVPPNNALGVGEGSYPVSFNYGFYAFVNLSVGEHILEFGGATGDFSNSVKATITVAPIPIAAGLPLLASGLLGLGLVARRRGAKT